MLKEQARLFETAIGAFFMAKCVAIQAWVNNICSTQPAWPDAQTLHIIRPVWCPRVCFSMCELLSCFCTRSKLKQYVFSAALFPLVWASVYVLTTILPHTVRLSPKPSDPRLSPKPSLWPYISEFTSYSIPAFLFSQSKYILGKAFLSCSWPSTITSVLSEFNSRKLLVIQIFISLRHAWSLVNWLVSSGFIDRDNWVSSA